MNAAHLHVMINHLPVIGIPLVAAVVGWGLYRGSRDVLRLGLALAVVVSAFTYPVYLAGDRAEEVVEDLAWADHDTIERHERLGKIALIITLITGGLAAVALFQIRKPESISKVLPAATVAALLISTGVLGWVALTGGEIRHDEFEAPTASGARSETDDHETDEH